MATTDPQIEAKAKELGRLIAEHPATSAYAAASEALQQDTDAERLLNEFNGHVTQLAQKQQQGQPIEVDDKKKLQAYQAALASNIHVSRFQKAQMDYTDLVRRAVQTLTSEAQPEGAGPAEPG